MIPPKEPKNEEERLNALESYNILDTLSEQAFDDITRIAAHICDTPISLVSLVDKKRQWFKSSHGLEATETPREVAYCAHAINTPERIFEIEDALNDERFHDNPLAVGDPYVRFYAGAPLISSNGLPLGTLCVIDHEPKKLNKSQKESLKALSKQVMSQLELRKGIKQLKDAKESAERAREEALYAAKVKENFLSTMNHEMKTPMNAILGITDLLLQENLTSEQIEHLNLLKFSGEGLLGLINDILDFNKIETGKIQLEHLDFNLKEVLSNVKRLLSKRAQEKGLDIILKYDEGLQDVFVGDAIRISQIITNLVKNSIKFTEEGYVKIELSSKGTKGNKAKIHFKIEDSGIGVSKKDQLRIFENFSQAEEDNTRKYGGTGLGLTITKKLLNLMGSDIFMESEPNKGSIFHFDILLALPNDGTFSEGNEKASRISPKDTSKKNIHVLVAEDNPANQFVLKKFLEKWGIEADVVENGLMALEKVKSKPYDLVLMDLQMPVMDGHVATQKIRSLEHSYAKNIPIIALSAAAMMENEKKIIDQGMTDIVGKPFNHELLYQKILKYAKRTVDDQASLKEVQDQTEEGENNFKIDSIINEVRKSFSDTVNKKLVFKIEFESSLIKGDKTKLVHSLMMVVNSIMSYKPDGNIRVSIDYEKKKQSINWVFKANLLAPAIEKIEQEFLNMESVYGIEKFGSALSMQFPITEIVGYKTKNAETAKNSSKKTITETSFPYLYGITNKDETMVQEIIEGVLDVVPVELDKMIEQYKSKDYKALARTSHKIKPNFENLEQKQFTKQIFEIESAAINHDDNYLDDKLKKFVKEAGKKIAELKNNYI